MKLNERTLSVLKNFSAINKHIIIKPGNIIKTVSPDKTILAKAAVQDEFPCEIPIYELNKLLNSIVLFEEPELQFFSNHLTISSGPSKIRFEYAEPTTLITAPDKDLVLRDILETVHVTEAMLRAIDRARKTLALEEISIEGDGEKLWMKALDASKSTDNEFAIEVGESEFRFKAVIEAEYLQVIPQSYDVSIDRRGVTYWKGDDIEYWIVLVAKHSELE